MSRGERSEGTAGRRDAPQVPRGFTRRAVLRGAAVAGAFAARLGSAGAGRYVLIARTAGDALNAAGASTPVEVTVP